ncbi:MAG TPA: hypothetical protein VG893_07830 [Terracidiphilus sp.]|nr:hypothetical protein [Terracidiphilus sp.]
MFSASAISQTSSATVNSADQIAALESALRQQAKSGNGTASAYLVQYPQYYAQLIVRTSSGEVEIHQRFDEIMIVLDGEAEVLCGGTPQNPHTIRPGELRAPAAVGGMPTRMMKGTVIHIPQDTPHHVVIPAEGYVAYLDIKIAHPQ